jgi:hypothetical protein
MYSYIKLGIRVLSILASYLDSQEQNYGQTWISLPISITTEQPIIIISHIHLLVANHNSDCVFTSIHTHSCNFRLKWLKKEGGKYIF